ncbi:MAG: response regulator [Candidatus Omnitrophica bacterium]|nr:response regulator [Candidatus Omnitrophota bacterium]
MNSKILIVDDEPNFVLVTKKLLEASGYKVIEAYSANEGLEKALEEEPDLILLDIIMPYKDGFKMLAELKKDELTRHIPVIFLTAKSETNFLFEGKRFGVTDYIIKPIVAEKLLKYVRKYLILSGK